MSDINVRTARHPIYDWLVCYEDGRIWSNKSNQWIKGSKHTTGHLKTVISINGKHIAYPYIHVLIWEAFNGILKPTFNESSQQIHHINKLKTDNRLENLQLLNHSEHMKLHNSEPERIKHISELGKKTFKIANEAHKKPVLQFTKNGEFVREWESIKDVRNELGIESGHISDCCSGKRKSTGGYIWKYKEAG